MNLEILAEKYRGFNDLHLSLNKNIFLVGDNSSGKSSILHLVQYIFDTELIGTPQLDEELTYDRYDFFSPYFNYSDVTIGYILTRKGKKTGRMVTLKRSKDLRPPRVQRFTTVTGGTRLTAVRKGSNVLYKIENAPQEFSPEVLKSLHFETRGFNKRNWKDDDSNSPINSLILLASILESGQIKSERFKDLSRGLAPNQLSTAIQTGPLRGRPERFYSFERKYTTAGTHFASMWHDLKNDGGDEGHEVAAVRKFGQDSQLFEDLNVEKTTKKVDHAPLLFTVQKRGKAFLVSQVGVGVSQVIPIVIESAYRQANNDDTTMLLQQPELHLHPIAQAALGEFLYSMTAKGARYIIETHSDFLIDRFRANMKENDQKISATLALCENRQDGNHCTQLDISENGEILNPPDNYKNFFLNELMRTMF